MGGWEKWVSDEERKRVLSEWRVGVMETREDRGRREEKAGVGTVGERRFFSECIETLPYILPHLICKRDEW